MSVGISAAPAPAPEWGKTEEKIDSTSAAPPAGGVSVIDAGRGMLSSLLGYLFSPVALLARKVVCTEPVASFVLHRYVQNKQPENVQWMVNNGMTFDKRHDLLTLIASENGDKNTLDLLLKHGVTANTLMALQMPDHPEVVRQIINDYDLSLGREHYPLVTAAAAEGDVETLKVLLTHKAPAVINLSTPSGFFWGKQTTQSESSPVREAVKGGHFEALKLLVAHGAPVNGGSFWTCGEVLKDALNADNNRTEMIEFLLNKNIFSGQSENDALPDDFVANQDVHNARQSAFQEALTAQCNDHILCMMLIELGVSGVEHSALDNDKCKSLYEKGIDLKILGKHEGTEAPEDYKALLKSAVDKAHDKIEAARVAKD